MIQKHVLDNGMTILIKEMHHAPVASFWVWYRVGSGDERPGLTGASHWVEHMLFNGTPQFPKGETDRLISRCGGVQNGMTWLDFTTYLEVVPSHEIDLGFRIEADRMINATFDSQEIELERTVVISERQGAENTPCFLLDEEVRAAAFRVHNYRHDTVGELCDLQTMARDELWRHYHTYYAPNNAIAVLVGDVEPSRALDRLQDLFGMIPSAPLPPSVRRPEPEQRGERRVIYEGEDTTAYLQLVYHVPQASHPDFFPLLVMDAILTGPEAMAFSGGGGTNHSSRLYQALVESGLASSVDGSLVASRDPYIYDLSATICTGHTLQETERVLLDELERISMDGISEEELAKAIKQAKAQFAYAAEYVSNQAYWIGWAEIVDSYEWFETYIDRLTSVTIGRVRDVARKYLRSANRTVGWYVPQGKRNNGP
ncbi:MAG: insulinase family protein [Anaerolineae bacterium]|nr:insulinase family protein [Anaerolineae bacterium]